MPPKSLLCPGLVAACLAVATSGCAAIHANKIAKRTNPKYRDPAQVVGPAVLLSPFECTYERRGVQRAKLARDELLKNVMPALWEAASGEARTRVAVGKATDVTQTLCAEFYEKDSYPGWNGNPALRAAVQQVVGTEQAVVAMFYAAKYACAEQAGTVRDKNGVVLGTVGTGVETCYENGEIDVFALVLSREGELIWHSGEPIDPTTDARAIAATLFEGYPRGRVEIVRTVE